MMDLSQNLQELKDKKEKQSFQQTQQHPFTGLFSQFHLYHPKINREDVADALNFGQIASSKCRSVEWIRSAYRSVWKKIVDYEQQFMQQQENEQYRNYQKYLEIKKKYFLRFFAFDQDFSQLDINNLRIFDSLNIIDLFQEIQALLQTIHELIKRASGANITSIKIEGYLFLQQLCYFLSQINIAIYPFNCQSKSSLTQLTKAEILQSIECYIEQDRDHHESLKFELKSFVDLSIYQLGCQIQNIEKSGIGKKNLDKLNKLKLLRFYHRITKYYYKYISQPFSIDRNVLFDFLRFQPLLSIEDKQDINRFKITKQLKFLSFQKCFRFHKRILQSIRRLSKNKSDVDNIMKKNGKMMLNMIISWIDLTQSSSFDLKLYQNYTLLLKIYESFCKGYLRENNEIIYRNLQRYVKGLIKYLFTRSNKIMSKIIDYDQQFTFQFLTTSRVIDTLLAQQTQIVQHLGSVLQFIKQVQQLSLKQDKIQLIEHIINAQQYSSSQSLRFKIDTPSKLSLSQISQIIEECIGFKFNQKQFSEIQMYLKELKYTIMLLKTIKNSMVPQTISINQQERYLCLQKMSNYFIKDRPICVFYQLKSNIMLFITLFQLGYYAPVIKKEGQTISLRKHIANLYNKLYTNRETKAFNSVIGQEIAKNVRIFQTTKFEIEERQYWINDQKIKDNDDSQVVMLGVDENFKHRLERFIRNFSSNIRDSRLNWKIYLNDLINMLENDLFLREKQHYKQSQQILTRHFQDFLVNSMELSKDQNIEKLSQIEGLFFNQQYQKSWKLLIKEKRQNQYFNQFLNGLLRTGGKKHEILNMLRIYSGFSKMDHLLSNQQNQQRNVTELVSHINLNAIFPIPQKAIEEIYRSQIEETRTNELELFYQKYKQAKMDKIQENYQQFKSCLSGFGIKTLKNIKNNKQTVLVKLPNEFFGFFGDIKKQIQKYFLFNHPGISRVNFVKIIGQQLLFQIEINPFFVLIPSPNKSKIQLNVDDFKQNNYEKLARNFAMSIIQTYSLLKIGEKYRQRIQVQQIFLDQKELIYNINPFFMFCLSILINLGAKIKIQQTTISNMEMLSNILQNIYNKLNHHFSPHFKSNYNSLIQYLRTVEYGPNLYNELLSFPLFMSLHQKEVFIIYFDNKMSQMCDKVYEKERQLRKRKKLKEIQQLRTEAMRTQVFQNYSYNFMISGIVQLQMIDQRVCCSKLGNKLDWIAGHQKLKISYQLPKDENGNLKEYAYSVNFLMKCLRGAIAHKMNLSYEIILSFNEEYPYLLDFLYHRKNLLEMTYSKLMQVKNDWAKSWFKEGSKSVTKLKNSITSFKKDPNTKMNSKIQQAFNMVIDYSNLYQDEIRDTLKKANVKCDKCNQLIKIAAVSGNLIDFMVNIGKRVVQNAKFLSVIHNYFGCFLLGHFRNHRQIKIFGERVQLGDIKNHLLVNWWFYLQTTFPSLIQMLTRLRSMNGSY